MPSYAKAPANAEALRIGSCSNRSCKDRFEFEATIGCGSRDRGFFGFEVKRNDARLELQIRIMYHEEALQCDSPLRWKLGG